MRKLFNKTKVLPTYKKNVIYMLSFFAVIYVLLIYLLGVYFGFYTATTKFSTTTLVRKILPISILIFITEYIREKILFGELKYKKILAYIFVVAIEIFTNVGKYEMSNINDFLAFWGYVIFTALANNLLFNYIAIRYGKEPNIVYRLITTLYVYIIPILPDVHLLIHTLIKLLLPYVIYITLEYTYPERNMVILKRENIISKIVKIVLVVVMIIITMLVSCKFWYGILVIGSESMTGTIDKGDAIIFEKYKGQNIKNNQILLFKSENKIIVHRIIEVKNIDGERRYFTKGDANKEPDEGYVTDEDVIGIYKFKINKIGYLTLLFNDIFEK